MLLRLESMIETGDGNGDAEKYGFYDAYGNVCDSYGIGDLKKVISKVNIGDDPDGGGDDPR